MHIDGVPNRTSRPTYLLRESYREGKKVRIFRDPLTWLRIDFKLRFTRVLREIEPVPDRRH